MVGTYPIDHGYFGLSGVLAGLPGSSRGTTTEEEID